MVCDLYLSKAVIIIFNHQGRLDIGFQPSSLDSVLFYFLVLPSFLLVTPSDSTWTLQVHTILFSQQSCRNEQSFSLQSYKNLIGSD